MHLHLYTGQEWTSLSSKDSPLREKSLLPPPGALSAALPQDRLLPASNPDWSLAGFSAQAEGTRAMGVGRLASQTLLPETFPCPWPPALQPVCVWKQTGKPWPSRPQANDPCHLLQGSNRDINVPDCRAQGTGLLSKVTPQLLVKQLIPQVLLNHGLQRQTLTTLSMSSLNPHRAGREAPATCDCFNSSARRGRHGRCQPKSHRCPVQVDRTPTPPAPAAPPVHCSAELRPLHPHCAPRQGTPSPRLERQASSPDTHHALPPLPLKLGALPCPPHPYHVHLASLSSQATCF